ncbi:MAG: glycosyltransferase family 4 protein [Candidatus Aminicenantes bacterium]|nr:glycosyltransferase family 4 protein [Candidatus Aminicenantes bacterium]
MKTVFIALYQAYPPVSGSASVSFRAARAWPGEKILFQLDDGRAPDITPDGLPLVNFRLSTDGRLRKLAGLSTRFSRISRRTALERPDVIVFEGGSWAPYYALLHSMLRRRCPRAVFVYHSHNVEWILRRERRDRAVVRGATKWAERRLLRSVDVATAVSEVDAGMMARLYGVRPMLLPNGIEIGTFDRISSADIAAVRDRYGLNGQEALFMGLLGFPPNDEAVRFLFRIFDGVVRMNPGARLVVLGGTVRESAPWLVNPGTIPFADVPTVIRSSALGLAPVFSGSGTRIKILEYAAAGIPVVATTKAAEGLPLRDRVHLRLADDEAAFTSAISDLYRDRPEAEAMGARGSAEVRRAFDWPGLVAPVAAACASLVEKRAEIRK